MYALYKDRLHQADSIFEGETRLTLRSSAVTIVALSLVAWAAVVVAALALYSAL